MKRKTIFLLILIALLPFSILCMKNVKAYNFEPGVQVGDILIYKYSSTSATCQDVTHLQVNVTEIMDGVGTTIIRGMDVFSLRYT